MNNFIFFIIEYEISDYYKSNGNDIECLLCLTEETYIYVYVDKWTVKKEKYLEWKVRWKVLK